MARRLARLVTLLATVLIMLISGASTALAGAKPPDPYPDSLKHAQIVGINKQTGEYCDLYGGSEKDQLNCRPPVDCEDYPANTVACVGEGSSDSDDALKFELRELGRWEKKADRSAPNYEKYHDHLVKCVKKDKKPFQECNAEAAGSTRRPPRLRWTGCRARFPRWRPTRSKRPPRCSGTASCGC